MGRLPNWVYGGVFAIVVFAGCGGGGSNNRISAQALGLVFKGLVADASVTVHALRPTGVEAQQLAAGQTDAQGDFQIPVLDYTGWALVRVVGGLTRDFLGNSGTIDPAFPLMSLVFLQAATPAIYSVTAVTTWLWYLTRSQMTAGRVLLDRAIFNAQRRLMLLFGFALPFLTMRPLDLARTSASAGDEANYGAIAHGLCELSVNLGIAEMELIHLMGLDLMDGRIDGLVHGREIRSAAGVLLPALVWTSLFPLAITNFVNSSFNQSGLSVGDIAAINALSTAAVLLTVVPRIWAIRNSFLDVNGTSTVRVIGEGLANPRVTVQGQEVDSTDVTPTADGLEFTVGAGFALGLDWGSDLKANLEIENQDSGLVAEEPDSLGRLDSSQRPQVDASTLSPTVVPSSGGAQVVVSGMNLSLDTQVRVGGMDAPVLAASAPYRLVFCCPPLADGPKDVEFENNGSILNVPSGLFVKSKSLDEDVTETDNDPQYSFQLQLGIDAVEGLKLKASYFDTQWTDADQGTATVESFGLSQGQPAVQTETESVTAFRSRSGYEEAVLYFNSGGFNNFNKWARNGDLRSGLGPDAISLSWKRPTGMVLDDIVGLHHVNAQQWNLSAGWWRSLNGVLEIGDDSVGSVRLRCRTWFVDGSPAQDDTIEDYFEILAFAADGHLQFEVPGGIEGNPVFETWFDGKGNVSVTGGWTGDSLIYGTTVRAGVGLSVGDAYGAYGGGKAGLRNRINGTVEQKVEVAFDWVGNSWDDSGANVSLRFGEENERRTDDTDIEFDFDSRLKIEYVAPDGVRRNESGTVVGAYYADETARLRLGGWVGSNGGSWGLQTGLPMQQSSHSVRGDFNGVFGLTEYAGGSSHEEGNVALAGGFDFADLDNPVVGGTVWTFGGRLTQTSGVVKFVERDASRGVTHDVSDVDYEIGFDLGYTILGRKLFVFAETAPPADHPYDDRGQYDVIWTGTVSPDGKVTGFHDGGAGSVSSYGLLFKRASLAVELSGDYRLGGLAWGYDPSAGGDKEISVGEGTLSFDTMAWTTSGSLGTFSLFENDTSSTGSTPLAGDYQVDANGWNVITQMTGAEWYLAPFDDGGTSFVGFELSANNRLRLLYGTRFATGAPHVGNYSTLALELGFPDFTGFPPKNAAGTGLFRNSFLSPGQIIQTGVFVNRSNEGGEEALFQRFTNPTLTLGSGGTVDYTEFGRAKTGGASDGCQWFATDEDDSLDFVQFQISYDF